MHESWPEEASVTHFLGKPPRPTKIAVAAVSLLVAAGLNLVVTGMYTVAGESASGNWLLNPVDDMSAMPALVFGAATVVWLGLVALFVWRGTPWVLRPARWTALAGVVACGLLGTLAFPGVSTVTKSEGTLTFYAVVTLLDTVVYLVAGVALMGRTSGDYFSKAPAGNNAPVPQQIRPESMTPFANMEPPKFDPPPFEPPKFGDPNQRR